MTTSTEGVPMSAMRVLQIVAGGTLVALLAACGVPSAPRPTQNKATTSTPVVGGPGEPAVEDGPKVDPPKVDTPKPPSEPIGKQTIQEQFLVVVRAKRLKDPTWMPETLTDPRDVKVYDHCRFSYTVFQVIDDNTSLIEVGGETLLLSGTGGHVDGRAYRIEGIIVNQGRIQYRTALGATRTVQAIRYAGPMPTLPPIERPPPEKKPEPPPPPPLPTATITPPKGETVPLAEAQYFIAAGRKEPAQLAKWVKDGRVKLLTAPAEVQVVSRDKEYGKVLMDGKEWVVESKWLPPEKK